MKLKYYSEGGMELTKAYTHAVGFDVKPMVIAVQFEDDETLYIDCRYVVPRDALLDEMRKREGRGQTNKIVKVQCDSGVHIEPEDAKFWVMACANSRIVRTNLVLQNGVGIIDPDYRGSVRFCYANLEPSDDIMFMNILHPICGQLVPVTGEAGSIKAEQVSTIEDLSSTKRGEKGFGSSSK